MDLKKRTVSTHFVDYSDLEAFIAQVYGVEFSFAADQECSNDSEHRFEVDGQYDQDEFSDFLTSPYSFFMAQTVLDKLCADKRIEPGCYVIEVCW
jgi:hypothetical protein